MSAPAPPPPRAPGAPAPPPPRPPSIPSRNDTAAPPPLPTAPRPPMPPPIPRAVTEGSAPPIPPRPAAPTSALPPPRPLLKSPIPSQPAVAAPENIGGFGVSMLDKVKQSEKSAPTPDDDDDDEWRNSDVDMSDALKPRTTSGLKAPMSKPPAVSKPPPQAPAKAVEAATAAATVKIAREEEKPPVSNPPPKPHSTATPPAVPTPTATPTLPQKSSAVPPAVPKAPIATTTATSNPLPTSSKTAAAPSAVSTTSKPQPIAALPTPATPSGAAPISQSASAPVSTATLARIKELEDENAALNAKLVRAASRIADLQASGKASQDSKSLIAREQDLERELDAAQDRIRKSMQENKSLEKTVTALRQQLTAAEAKRDYPHGSDMGSSSMPATTNLRRAQETEKLKEMYEKAKLEKDKAIRALIHVIGKDRVAAFLHKNAGSSNILDSLLEQFAGQQSHAMSINESTLSPKKISMMGARE